MKTVNRSGFIEETKTSSIHETPQPATSRQPTPAEALELKIKLPWAGKVQLAQPEQLTKDLFLALENYGLSRGEIAELFSTHRVRLVAMLAGWKVPKGKPCIQNLSARAENTEKPVGKKPMDLSRGYHDTTPGRLRAEKLATKPGQTQLQTAADTACHSPTPDEVEDVFRPEDDLPVPFVPVLSLRDCAAKLVQAIDAREKATQEIEFYTSEIRRLA